jgi:hypothetical protein
MMKLGWFFSLILFSFSADATLTLTSVSGASNFTIGTTSTGTGTTTNDSTIYGGVIASSGTTLACGAPAASEDCNSCNGTCQGAAATTICQCNQKGIHDNRTLSIVLTSTQTSLAGRSLVIKNGTTNVTGNFPSPTMGTNTVTLNVPWGTVCTQGLGSTNTCFANLSQSLTFTLTQAGNSTEDSAESVTIKFLVKYVDQTIDAATYTTCEGGSGVAGQGICWYKIFPGDEKVYIDDVTGDSGFPSAGSNVNDKYQSLLFYYQENTASGITNALTPEAKEISVDTTTGEFDDRITGLTNDRSYCFILGHKDMTGNISHFEDPNGMDPGPVSVDRRVCATPSAVIGLLDNKKCFIATAAFGSNMNPYVVLLREFRTKVLGQFSWGRNFIRFYYDHSPDWAKVIRHNEDLKGVVRFFLWPVIGFAALCLKIGMFSATLLVIAALFGLVLLVRHRKKLKMKLGTKYFILFLILFVGFSLYSPAVYAQDEVVDDTEEGGPPMEAPFVNEDPEGEIMGESQDKKSEEPQLEIEHAGDEEKQTSPIIEDQILPREEAPVITQKYNVPKKPTTEQGKLTGKERIAHPQSKMGLKEIEEDGSYIYEPYKFPTENISASLHLGQINPAPQIEGSTEGITYESIYGNAYPTQVQFDFEWHPLTGFGKLGLVGGVGLFRSTGKGRFENTGAQAREEYTFYGVPVSLGAVYRLQLTDKPWMAPYITGGGSYYLLGEKRDDDKPWKFVATPALFGGGGMLFNISAFDRETSFTLASEYGVQNIWLSIEARYIQALNVNLDVSGTLISAGLVLDY